MKIFKMATMVVILDIVTNDFSNSESPYGPNASHQALAHSNLPFRSRCGLKILKMAAMVAIFDVRTEGFYQF